MIRNAVVQGTVEWFRWVKAPTTTELNELTRTINAHQRPKLRRPSHYVAALGL